MTLEQLRIFVAVAERQHITKAAQALNLAQSAVSASISALEERHGTRLFHRVGRGIDTGRAVPAEPVSPPSHSAVRATPDHGMRRGREAGRAGAGIAEK